MKKVLYIGDGGAPTGFASVSHNILSYIDSKIFDIYHLAVNYRGDPHPFPWKMFPAALARDFLGINRIKEFAKIGLEGIFILNDPWVIDRYLEEIKKTFGKNIPNIVVYFPIDSTDLSAKWFKNFDIVSKMVVYTNFAKEEVEKVYKSTSIDIVPHGVDLASFNKISGDKEAIKKLVYPGRDDLVDSFIVLNANRNQPRKRIDLTLEGFKLFSEGKPQNVKLYLHMGIKDIGYDIIDLAEKLNIDDRLIITSEERTVQSVSIQRLNYIYNATDVGLNTCKGEGWSLTNMEHAVTGAVQVVPDHSALTELYSDCGVLIPTSYPERNMDVLTVGRIVTAENVAKALQYVYDHKDEDLGAKGQIKFSSPEFEWKNIVETYWNPIFKEFFYAHKPKLANSSRQRGNRRNKSSNR